MRRKAFGSNAPLAADAALEVLPGPDACASTSIAKMPSVSPAPDAALAFRNVRRDTVASRANSCCIRCGFMFTVLSEALRRFLDRRADAHVRRAATDVARHRGIDVRVGRPFLRREQRRCRH